MSDTETVSANGLDFAYHRYGDGDRLALCLHGFPDDARSLDPICEQLADAGFTAIAPYMRGYGPTDRAPDDDYSARALSGDAVALADTLVESEGFEDAVLVGHDWGAVAGYGAAQHNPERFEKLVTMAVPPNFEAEIWNHPRQFLRSWYVWFFQLPGIAERTLQRNDFALVEVLWNLWSPGWDYSLDRLDAVKDTFRTEGTPEAALQYYRQFVNPLVRDTVRNGPPDAADSPGIEVPGLVITGAEDGCIGHELFGDAADAFAADCRVIRLPSAGHFMHRERPDVVGDEIVSFLSD
jgi:pimeloyl-ACP methyl ester carboxylesterase